MYKESKEYLIVFHSLPSTISGSVCIKIFYLYETYGKVWNIFICIHKISKKDFCWIKISNVSRKNIYILLINFFSRCISQFIESITLCPHAVLLTNNNCATHNFFIKWWLWGEAQFGGQSIITIKPEHRISIFLLIGVFLHYVE